MLGIFLIGIGLVIIVSTMLVLAMSIESDDLEDDLDDGEFIGKQKSNRGSVGGVFGPGGSGDSGISGDGGAC